MAATQALTALPTAVALLAASQPDIIRASQKDDLYVQQLTEATQEAVRRLLGPFRAMQSARETKLVALALYYGLTTGAGQQTLGEEYCNMLQSNDHGQPPVLLQRLFLAVLQSVGPYLADRVAARLDVASQGDAGPGWAEDSHSSPGNEAQEHGDDGWRQTHEPAAAHAARGLPGSPAAAARHVPLPVGNSAALWAKALRRAIRNVYGQCITELARGWPKIRPAVAYAGRLHLALFYSYGVYYSLAQRLARVRYTLTARPLQRHVSYRVLGLLLTAQLIITAAAQAHSHLARAHAARGAGAASTSAAAGGSYRLAADGEHAVFLEADDDEGADEAAGLQPAGCASSSSSEGRRASGEPCAPPPPAGVSGGWELLSRPGGPTRRSASSSGGSGAVEVVPPAMAAAAAAVGVGAVPVPVPVQPSVVSTKQCPLCLSAKRYPASTPCGHTFCWECIASWCCEKPECPLCRAAVRHNQLVCLYHSDC